MTSHKNEYETLDDGLDDDLDRYVAQREQTNPGFLHLYDAAVRERQLLRALAAKRVQLGLTQRAVAVRMKTSQAAVARLERGEVDPKLSTIERFAAAVGQRVAWQVVDDETSPNGRGAADPDVS